MDGGIEWEGPSSGKFFWGEVGGGGGGGGAGCVEIALAPARFGHANTKVSTISPLMVCMLPDTVM